MISLFRINAIILRHLIPTFRDPIRITDMLYYPLIDLVLMGFMAMSSNSIGESNLFVKSVLCGVSCWYLVYRSSLEIVKNLLMEIWEHCLTNLLATPHFGKTAESLCWAVPWLFAVISGAWFPLKLFPAIVQKIAFLFPMAYLFEGVRAVILENSFSLCNLLIGIALSLGYFILVAALFIYMFNKSKQQGLSRLD